MDQQNAFIQGWQMADTDTGAEIIPCEDSWFTTNAGAAREVDIGSVGPANSFYRALCLKALAYIKLKQKQKENNHAT